MKPVTAELLDEIVRRIVDALRPVAVYLFGSRASGEARPGSDVDLLAVVEDAPESRRELACRGRRSLWGIGVPVDLLVFTTADVQKWADVPCNIIHTVMSKGRLVYDARG